MKRILLFLFLFITITLNATTYYISTTGNNSNNGSIGSPWLTLAYASTHTASGDIIHVNAGTHALTASVSIIAGVSIEGDGVTSVFTSNIAVNPPSSGAAAWTLKLNSPVGSNGNQHISNIKMDGLSTTAWGAIGVQGRSNVEIYNCTFINFYEVAVTFNGAAGYTGSAPSTYATGNKLHDCIITNCAVYRTTNYGAGNVMIGGQNGLLIYNNTIIQTARSNNLNGYCIKYYNDGHNRAIKIYNNYLETAPRAGTELQASWGFVLEQWNPEGGWEIYGNTIKGCLDLVNIQKGSYAFSFDIHNNTIGFDATPPTSGTQGDVGIRLEAFFQSVNIYKNHFKNNVASIYASAEGSTASNGLNVYYNLFENIGGNNATGWAYRQSNTASLAISNVNFYNNVMIASTTYSTNYGIIVPFGGTVSNVNIKNNIIQGFDQAPVQRSTSGTISGVAIQYNNFYQNGNSNVPSGSGAATVSNNYTVNPPFVSTSDFHLQGSSTLINNGTNVGLATDYVGNQINGVPEIGAYEYGTIVTHQYTIIMGTTVITMPGVVIKATQ